ncbi:MAG: hypothetical protein ABIM49_03830 [candidate division WOR-3 bacterium]
MKIKLTDKQFEILNEAIKNFLQAQRELKIILAMLNIPEEKIQTLKLNPQTKEVEYEKDNS